MHTHICMYVFMYVCVCVYVYTQNEEEMRAEPGTLKEENFLGSKTIHDLQQQNTWLQKQSTKTYVLIESTPNTFNQHIYTRRNDS